MRRVWTFGLFAGILVCTITACTEEVKQSQPNGGFEGKPELKQLPPPGNPGGAPKQKGGNAPKAE